MLAELHGHRTDQPDGLHAVGRYWNRSAGSVLAIDSDWHRTADLHTGSVRLCRSRSQEHRAHERLGSWEHRCFLYDNGHVCHKTHVAPTAMSKALQGKDRRLD